MNVKLISKNSVIHNKDCWNIIYVEWGEVTVTLNSSVYKLSGGSMMLVSPDDFCYINSGDGSFYRVVSFKLEDEEDLNLKSKVFNLGTEEKEIIKTLLSTKTVSQNQILLQLLLDICENAEENIEPLNTEKTMIFKEVTVMMERYITASVKAYEFADMVDISLSGLKRIFAKYTGIGIHDYFLMLKIKKARELLASGYSVTRTAKVLQFSSQAYFSTAFKRVAGISAKSYSMGKSYNEAVKRKVSQNQIKTDIKRSANLPDYLL